MITYSGIHIQKIGGVEGTPTPMDIAVHAGRICRFGGAVWYPLLPHLVFVGLLAYRRSNSILNLLWGFLHDAHETVTSDVPRPFKCDCMRAEQKAIDERLLVEYFGDRYFEGIAQIDFDLIKTCDTDACHIEAVELGVPNFAETEIGHSKDYTDRTEIYSDDGDRKLFRRILVSPFFVESTTWGEQSEGVRRFAEALDMAKLHKGEFFKLVKSWQLL